LVTLLGGMAVRALTGRGVAWSFVLVAGAVLALLLLGWRWLEARRTAETAAD
jgi:membrane protein implicated in regulation of membrane protease activity